MHGKYDGSAVKTFKNGVQVGTISASGSIGNYDTINGLGIGDKYQTGQPFNGIVEEVRISDIARSDAWIKADFYNLVAHELVTFA